MREQCIIVLLLEFDLAKGRKLNEVTTDVYGAGKAE